MEEQRNIELDSKIDSSLIRLLGLSVYGDCRKYWNLLEAGEQIRLCGEANRYGLGPYFYWALRHDLPEREHDRFKAQYVLRSAAAMKNQQALTRLYNVFEKEHIRFAPMKGIDLAYRHYPSPALRWFGDWDILFHPDDCEQALEVLKHSGWEAPYLDSAHPPGHHHYVRHYREAFQLEPHWTLPQFSGIEPRELWRYIYPMAPGAFRHVLSPELKMLLLTRHAAAGDYRHFPGTKLLLDAAFLMRKEPIDWTGLARMAARWNLPYSGNLLGAWPEFFSAEYLNEMKPDARMAQAFRNIFDMQFSFENVSSAEWVVNQKRVGTVTWIRQRLRGIRPQGIRMKYHLPEHGSLIRLAAAYTYDLSSKFFRFLWYSLHRNLKVKDYYKLIDEAEGRNAGR